MVAYTTTYNLKKPTVADDEDVWGGYLNDSMDLIDDVLNGTTPVTGIDINSGTVDNVVIGGTTAVAGTFTVLTADTSLGVTGNITVSGTVDGRDVAADGTKLDGVESGATADQTKADIDALGIAASTAATLASARNIAVTGAVTGNANFDGSGNISISTTATSDPTVTLTGAVTGSGTMTNLGNVSIATTATADPTLTLSGDASGSATFTNLGNATLTVTVADDSHNHVISNVDGLQTALDGKLSTSGKAADSNLLDGIDSSAFLRSDANDSYSGILTGGELAQGQHPVHTGYYGIWNTQAYGVDSQNYMIINAGNDTYITGNDAVYIRGADNSQVNEVVVTTSGTTIGGNTVWHAGNDGSGSGLDADLWDGNQFSSYLNQAVLTSSSPTFNNAYIAGGVYHSGDTNTALIFDTDTITLATGGSSEITVNTTGVRLGDTGNGYFRPVSGNYGSIEIDGGAHTGWEGYNIGGHSVFMSNGSTTGIYNDANNQWILEGAHNGTTHLHYAGTSKLQTQSTGALINGNLYLTGSVGEDYDALSGTSPTCNVDNAGAFSLTMSGNTTFTFSGADSGYSMGFILQLTGNGSTVTWPASVDWAGGTAPDAPASGETDIYVFWTRDGGTTWYGVQSIDAAA